MKLIQIGSIGYRDSNGEITYSKPLYAKQTKQLKEAKNLLLQTAIKMFIKDLLKP